MNIVILESLAVAKDELASLKKPFEAEGHVFAEYERTSDIPQLIKQVKDAQALIVADMALPGDVIRGADHLQFIDVAFTGVDHIDLEAAKEKGVAVSNAAGYSNQAVAELALGMSLSLARNMRETERSVRSGGTKEGLIGWEIQGKTVGILGYGKIGRRTAELFHAFGANIIASSRSYKDDAAEYVEQVDVDSLLQESDIVVLHVPLNDSTRGMIDADKIALMKSTAILINVARGPVVNAQDLADALNNDVIAGAGIDVFDQEPPLDLDEPLLQAKNTLVTPHIAFASEQSMSLRAQIVFENLRKWLEGEQENVIL